jgi:hypothetical protein
MPSAAGFNPSLCGPPFKYISDCPPNNAAALKSLPRASGARLISRSPKESLISDQLRFVGGVYPNAPKGTGLIQ